MKSQKTELMGRCTIKIARNKERNNHIQYLKTICAEAVSVAERDSSKRKVLQTETEEG